MKPDRSNIVEISKRIWQQVIAEGRKSIMNQYIVYYQDGGTEYVDAYSYTWRGSVYTFDIGHGEFKTCVGVKAVEVL